MGTTSKATGDEFGRVGFVGLGQMGVRIAGRLVDTGREVFAYDPSPDAQRAAEKDGITIVDRPSQLTESCNVVFICAPTSDVVISVCFDEDTGLCAPLAGEPVLTTVIDLTSGNPAKTAQIVSGLAAQGIGYVDAPVSGNAETYARSGELTLLVGASESELEQLRPLLSDISNVIHHLGPAGSGHVGKALNNLLNATAMIATSEVVVAAMKYGMDPDALVAAIQDSSGRNYCTEYRFPNHILRGDFSSASGGATYLIAKDCAQAVSFARAVGTPMPAGNVIAELVQIAAATYGGQLPSTNMARLYGQWAGVDIGGAAATLP